MKVVGVTPLYPPYSRVGAWLQTHECLRALAERGHEVFVYKVNGGPGYELDGVKVSAVGSTVSQWIGDADVVISHHGDTKSNTAQAARVAGVPHVVMVHGEVGAKPLADLVVCNSHSQARNAKRWKLPTIVVRPVTKFSEHRSPRGQHVTLVNNSVAKGGDVLARVADAMPDTQFLAVKGDWGAQCRYRMPNVRQIASTANMRRHVWRETRVLLMPSEKETWGMTGVEAMCSGIPVIAHPTPGLKESLSDAGIFVDRRNIDGWIEAIQSFDDPNTYRTASETATRRAREIAAFDDVERFADRIETLA